MERRWREPKGKGRNGRRSRVDRCAIAVRKRRIRIPTFLSPNLFFIPQEPTLPEGSTRRSQSTQKPSLTALSTSFGENQRSFKPERPPGSAEFYSASERYEGGLQVRDPRVTPSKLSVLSSSFGRNSVRPAPSAQPSAALSSSFGGIRAISLISAARPQIWCGLRARCGLRIAPLQGLPTRLKHPLTLAFASTDSLV